MHADDLLVDNSTDRNAIKDIAELLPQLDVEAPLALVVEAVYSRDGGALVVAAEKEEVLRELELVRKEQRDGLQALLATVHVVAQEQVVALRREAAVLEEPEQVVVLAVHVAADLDRRLQLQQRALRQEGLAHGRAERSQLALGEVHELPGLGALSFQAPLNHAVHIQILHLPH
eukprot:CAMPEP_0168370454 /NCGR_PEP_ID=MMETSP0228-20121227/7273_1 /TAXON_ID=133427 /ORGANISM="Protoceratium reticulatum, Strain CCCM 535 (=CCMP 1889)" /LENGTH=173 /DNA_ID=CAMNT_0008383329 /DNA_START=607 /DNA_END=1128 /DNA_ORIENTATION=+